MKRILPLSLLLFVILSFSFTSLQTNDRYFVQFKINSIETAEQAQHINKQMSLNSNIEASRADYYTSTYFCYLTNGSNSSEEDFKIWFEKLGYKISCFNKGIETKDIGIEIDVLKNCTDEK